jgi:hypothetical protein
VRGTPLQPGEHSIWVRRHRAACRECRNRYNAYGRRRRLAAGATRASFGAVRTSEELARVGELYGDKLRNAVTRHLCAHPVGLTARDIARALRMANPDGGGQIRVRYQLRRIENGGQAVYRDELRADGSARTCRRWYPAAAAPWAVAA